MKEILGTLFAALLSLLGIAAVGVVLFLTFGTNKTQNAISDLIQLQASVTQLYNGQNNFTSLTNTVVINGKLAPKSMISGATLLNPWGGAVVVNVNASNPARFDVTEPKVPADSCAKMIQSFSSVIGLSVNGTAQTLPMDAGNAVAACGNGDDNTLVLTFGS